MHVRTETSIPRGRTSEGMAEDNSIPLSWILLFLLLLVGVGVGAVFFVGGDIMAGGGVIAPVPA